jgi:hypothetical protein
MSNEYTKFDTAEVALQCDLPDGVDLPSDRQSMDHVGVAHSLVIR